MLFRKYMMSWLLGVDMPAVRQHMLQLGSAHVQSWLLKTYKLLGKCPATYIDNY